MKLNLILVKTKGVIFSFFIIILIFTFSSIDLLAQPTTYADRLSHIIPASPAVAEFQKYIDYPVSHTTGVPEISIPLYEINTGKLRLPISLSYHSSGCKVDDQTGIIGLGWVLNAGGTVSRKIVNKPDEFNYFPFPYRDAGYLNQNLWTDFSYISDLRYESGSNSNGSDGEYDVFYYNTGSSSGKFYLASDGYGKRKPVVVPYEPISIKSNNDDFHTFSAIDYFEITDEVGNIYRFGKSSTDASTAIEQSIDINNGTNTTAWFLKEIYSADRTSSIKFIYSSVLRKENHRSDIWEIKDYRRKIAVYNFNPFTNICDDGPCEQQAVSTVGQITQHPNEDHGNLEYNSSILSEIQFTGGSISFEYVGNTIYVDGILLKKIKVKDELGNEIKKIELDQNSLNGVVNGNNFDHYGLTAIRTVDPIGNTNSKHEFIYNPLATGGAPTSPNPNSTAVDYWGYYNGQDNFSLTPPFEFNAIYQYLNTTYLQTVVTSYNNREADETRTKSFVLNTIKYPTGGSTSFEYESNRANDKNVGGLRVKKIISTASAADIPLTKEFRYGVLESGNGILLQDPYDIHSYLTTTDFDFVCSSSDKYFCIEGSSYAENKYRISTIGSDLNNGGDLNSGCAVFYPEVTEYSEGPNALFDGSYNGKTVYTYEPPMLDNEIMGTNIIKTHYDEWKTNHLKTKTEYAKTGPDSYIPVSKVEYDYSYTNNSLLKCTKVVLKKYDPNNAGINTLWANYNPTIDGYIRTLSLWNVSSPDPTIQRWSYGEVYNVAEYYRSVGVKLLSSRKVTQFTAAGNIVTTENYTYGANHNKPLTITSTNSKGETQTVFYKYPHDFVSQQPYADMVNTKHIWTPVIEQSTYKGSGINSMFLQSVRTNYGFWDGNNWTSNVTNIIVPQNVESKQLTQPNYETRFRYDKYDDQGNILTALKEKDVLNTFIWGYNKQYPVAKIIGKSYNEAVSQSGINLSVINSLVSTDAEKKIELNKLRSLSGCFVTTYTYKPLVGISTETDPNGRTTYYEYDKINRLVLVRDFQFKILKKICYNYSGQPVDCQSTPLFFNTMQSQTFTRNNCGSCSQGSVVNYVVSENTFSSTVSIPDANQLALNYIAQNGQAYANTYGTCGTTMLPLTYNNQINGSGGTGFTAVYSTKAPGPSYTFNIPPYGSGSLGCIPAGQYTLTISKPGNNWLVLFSSGCFVQSGTSAVFGKVNPVSCSQVTLQLDFQ